MSGTTTFENYRGQIAKELAARVQAHQDAIAAAVPAAPQATPLNLLADGDSWFDYPLNGLLPQNTDIIAQLPARLVLRPTILNLAHHGEATTNLLGTEKATLLLQSLTDKRNGKFDAILFSGGGNDVAGDQFRLWLYDSVQASNEPADALDAQVFGDLLGIVQAAYLDLAAIRDKAGLHIPIFVHAYDFAQPTNVGVCGQGPWLYPSLASRGWMTGLDPTQIARGALIVAAALRQFDAMLTRLAANPQLNFIHVTTQGTLDPQTGWANELHPTPEGFKAITVRFATALAAAFGARAALVP